MILIGILFISPSLLKAQPFLTNYDILKREYKFFANDSLGPFQLPDSFILHQSDEVFAGERQLSKNNDYYLNEIKGRIFFSNPLPGVEVTIRYRTVPISIPLKYQNRKIYSFQLPRDSTDVFEKKIDLSEQPTSYDVNLNKSGSILRAITVGTGQDMSIESALRLELDGNITEDVEVKAVLSDQTTNIPTEGNTTTLKELDRIYIHTKSPTTSVILGDYLLDFGYSNRLSQTKKQVQGAQFQWTVPRFQTSIAGAITRARYRSLVIVANEGNQGPYLLTDGEQNLPTPVVPGSEKIRINGVDQIRGETENYVIDYSTGELTFTTRTPIKQDSRISIEYETIPGYYNRGLFAWQASGRTIGSKYKWSAGYYSESDDTNNPIGITLTDSAKSALQNAGTLSTLAYYQSERYVGMGNGDYVKLDTVYAGQPFSMFRFVPPDTNLIQQGDYEVQFTKVSQGDYQIDFSPQIGKSFYYWVGSGLGEYLPIIKVPLPQKKEIINVTAEVQPIESTSMKIETAISQYDANTLSSKNGLGLKGGAIQWDLQYNSPLQSGRSVFQTNLRYREIESNFISLESMDNTEEYRKWGSKDTLSRQGQITREIDAILTPLNLLTLRSGYGDQFRDDGGQSNRFHSAVGFQLQNYNLNTSGEWIQSKNVIQRSHEDIVRLTQRQSMTTSFITSVLTSSYEQNLSDLDSNQYGYKRLDNQFKIGKDNNNNQSFYLTLDRRIDWKKNYEQFRLSLRSVGYGLSHSMNRVRWNVNSEYNHIVTRFLPNDSLLKTDLFFSTGTYKTDNHAALLNWNYHLNSTSSSKQNLFAYRVPLGQGTHIKIGEQFIPNPEGDWVLYTRPTGDYEPVIDLNVSISLNTYLDRITSIQWKGVNTETRIEILEQSKTKKPLSLLLLNAKEMLNENTLSGKQWLRNDLIYTPDRYKYWRMRTSILREKSNRYLSGSYENRNAFLSIFFRNSFLQNLQWSLEPQYERKTRTYLVSSLADRSSHIYRFIPAVSLQQQLKSEYRLDGTLSYQNEKAQKIDWYELGLTPSYTYFWKNTSRLYFEFDWKTILSNNSKLPYDLASGRQPGNNWRWSIRGDFRLGKNMNGSLYYRGIKDHDFPVRNEGRAEVMAFF